MTLLKACAAALGSLAAQMLLAGTAAAASFAETADQYLNLQIRNQPTVELGDPAELKQNLESLYRTLEGAVAPVPTVEQLDQFVRGLPERKLIDRDTARQLVQLVASRATDGDYADFHGPMLLLLHPYVKEAGGCKPDPANPSTLLCMFSVGQGEFDGKAQFSQGDYVQEPQTPAAGTDLAHILAPGDCQGAASTSTTQSSAAAAPGDRIVSNQCFGFQYWTTYGYKYETTWYGTTRVWAEGFGFAALGLSTSMADTIVADLPVGLRCDWKCWLSIASNCLGKLIRGETDKFIACALNSAEKRQFRMHGDGSYISHYQARSCNVMQAKATDRQHFKAYQSGQYDGLYELPPAANGFVNKSDLRFQTHFQYPSISATIANDGRNLYPLPTTASLNPGLGGLALPGSGLPSWTHRFSQIAGWNFNILFNAADALVNTQALNGGSCAVSLKHPRINVWAYGDQFQVYHGSAADLPEYNIIVGWRTYHPAYTCLKNFTK